MVSYHINDVTLAVHEQGTGLPVLFVHGYPFDHSLWNPLFSFLPKNIRAVAPDLRGLGASSLPPNSSVTSMEQFADDLHSLLQAMHIQDKIVLAGLSMGGYIAMQFARKYTDQLAGLLLCGTKTAADTPGIAENRRKQAAGLNDGSLSLRDIADTMIPKLFASATPKQKPETVKILRSMIESNNPLGAAAATRGMSERSDTTDILRNLNVPVLVLCGLEDQFSPAAEMRQLAATAKHGILVEIANAGHLPPMEQPELFANALKNFSPLEI